MNKTNLQYFTKKEWIIWLSSLLLLSIVFLLLPEKNIISYIASLIGATALIFTAKANPFGNILFIVFSILYAYNSFLLAYYGEVFNFLCINTVLSFCSFVSWIKNLDGYNRQETKINNTNIKSFAVNGLVSVFATLIMYFILKYFGTSNLIMSTFSVATNFMASLLMIQRSKYFSLAYAFNDVVVIFIWLLASFDNVANLTTAIYFFVTLINDIYIYINWKKIEKSQNKEINKYPIYK